MKAIGTALCAAGVVTALLAFFWKDPFDPGGLSRGLVPTKSVTLEIKAPFPSSDGWSRSCP